MLSFDSKGNELLMSRHHIDDEIPKGWEWINDWEIDISGSVASDGKFKLSFCYKIIVTVMNATIGNVNDGNLHKNLKVYTSSSSTDG